TLSTPSFTTPHRLWPAHASPFRPTLRSLLRAGDVLVDEDRVAVGISEHEVRGAGGGFISGGGGSEAAGLEGFLDVTHILKVGERGFGAVPAGVEGQHVPLEHALEEADLG